jgi:hypothetical protein
MKNMKMQICICGWHYYPDFYKTLSVISERYEIFIIAHKEGDTSGLPCVPRENTGLEWGAYSFFQNIIGTESQTCCSCMMIQISVWSFSMNCRLSEREGMQEIQQRCLKGNRFCATF